MNEIKLRDYQEYAVDSVFNYLEKEKGNPLIVMPTGTGKSFVIASIIKTLFEKYINTSALVLTHVQELIEQNYDKLQQLYPLCDSGINSAGLRRRDYLNRVVFGGIASVRNKAQQFGKRDLIIVDECHLISSKKDSMYNKFIRDMRMINPNVIVVGLTATHYRLKDGILTGKGQLFDAICCDMSTTACFQWFIANRYMCPLIVKKTKKTLDVAGIKKHHGEYDEKSVSIALTKQGILQCAADEITEKGQNRNSWLIFCSSIKDCETMETLLNDRGIDCRQVHSKMKKSDRVKNISDWKNGDLRCIVNQNVMTTGIDNPKLDLIGVVRATMSPGLWVQILGRGTRPGKENCLVLDFAGNTLRLGPLNDPVIPNKAGKGDGEVPLKLCEECECYNHISARTCHVCGAKFKFEIKFKSRSFEQDVLNIEPPKVTTRNVSQVFYNKHTKEGSPDSLRVTYMCGNKYFSEWVCLEHTGYAKTKAAEWWKNRAVTPLPKTIDTALTRTSELEEPIKIDTWKPNQYDEILKFYWKEDDEETKDTFNKEMHKQVRQLKEDLPF